MKVSFFLKRRDFVALHRTLVWPGSPASFWLLPVMMTVFSLKLAISNPVLPLWTRGAQVLGAVLFWAVFVLAFPLGNALAWRRELRRRNFDLRSEVELQSEGIIARDGEIQTETPWTRIRSIRSNAKYVMLVRFDSTGLIIPCRAFATSDEAQSFARFAHTQLHLAHPLPPGSTPPPIATP